MRKHLIYDGLDEASNRLSGTIVTYDGQPVKIVDVASHDDGVMRLRISAHPFDGRARADRKRIDSPSFRRFQTPPLGYCNFFEGGLTQALWCERVPARTRRQGLCDETFSAVDGQGRRIRLDRLAASEAFREMIVGEYPEFGVVVERLVPNSSIAVSRDFALEMAVDGFVKLIWRREPIALVLRDTVFLRNDRQYLLETISACPSLPARVEVL